jgi:hypothetical protein
MAPMMQITYQPAFDPYHAVFRLARLREIIAKAGPLHQDYVRVLDFFLLFPFQIDTIRLMPAHRKFKRLAEIYASSRPYGDLPENRTLFDRMEPMQTAAMQTFAARELLDPKQLEMEQVASTSKPLPDEIAGRVAELNTRDQDLLTFMEALASEYDLMGPNGLKARAGLLEYRYDPV